MYLMIIDAWDYAVNCLPYKVYIKELDRNIFDLEKSEYFEWCTEIFGASITHNRFELSRNNILYEFKVNETATWDVSGSTFYFKYDIDALNFKLRFG